MMKDSKLLGVLILVTLVIVLICHTGKISVEAGDIYRGIGRGIWIFVFIFLGWALLDMAWVNPTEQGWHKKCRGFKYISSIHKS